MIEQKDGIKHLESCARLGRYDRYEERISHSSTQFMKTCKDCGQSSTLWYSCVFGEPLTPNQRSRKERELLSQLYTPSEKEEKRLARSAWLSEGRKGHAPGCKRTHKAPVVLTTQSSSVSYATNVYTLSRCPGCKGVFYDSVSR